MREVAARAAEHCEKKGVDIAKLAVQFSVANEDMDGSSDIGFRDALGDPFLGTAAMAWMEVF